MAEKTQFLLSALRDAVREEMARDESVFIMGEDVAAYGGVYRVSLGLLEEFGPLRVRDTPISEAAIVGAGVGAAMQGLRPIVEIMYVDFIPIALDQIVNQASQAHFISGGQVSVPLVIRTQGGAGSWAGAQHSKSLEAWFTHIPGVKVVAPSTPYNAKGLLKAAVRDDNPVIFLEHKLLYRAKGVVPEDDYIVELGRADVARIGDAVTIIAWSRMVGVALEAAKELAKTGIEAEVIDLQTLSPLDEETIFRSIMKTNRAVIVQEAWRNCGFGAEIAARIQEGVFDYLDAPVVRAAGADSPIPFSPPLEERAIPGVADIVNSVQEIL